MIKKSTFGVAQACIKTSPFCIAHPSTKSTFQALCIASMNAQARMSISRLIDDLSTPQDDDQTGGVVWKPTAAKLVDLELMYTSPPAAALSGTPDKLHQRQDTTLY